MTAKKDPMCKLTSIDKLEIFKFNIIRKIIKCEEELIAKIL